MPPRPRKPKLLRDGPSDARATLLLAHGAGAGMRHPFMQQLAEGLATRGVAVIRFEFPYMQKRVGTQRRPPDPQPVLLESYARAWRARSVSSACQPRQVPSSSFCWTSDGFAFIDAGRSASAKRGSTRTPNALAASASATRKAAKRRPEGRGLTPLR